RPAPPRAQAARRGAGDGGRRAREGDGASGAADASAAAFVAAEYIACECISAANSASRGAGKQGRARALYRSMPPPSFRPLPSIAGALFATSACAAQPPPQPRARGSIASHGGALGDWQVTLDRCSADETRVLTVDLHGPGSFQHKRFLRVTRVAADEDGTPTIDVELVDAKSNGGPYEIVIDP